jgi:hypothetical protein
MSGGADKEAWTLSFVVRVVCVGFIASLALCPKLWMEDRLFPLVPVFDWLNLPALVHTGMYGGMFVCLGVLMWRPMTVWAAACLVALWFGLVLQDQMRLQPWAYQYVLMLVPLFWRDKREMLRVARMVIIAVYFWGGVHKFGAQFTSFYQGTLIAPWLTEEGGAFQDLLRSAGGLIPWIETAMALLLIFPVTRRAGVVLAWGTHVIILVWLGPLGQSINTVIWPWNMAMVVLVSALFWNWRLPLLSLVELKAQRAVGWVVFVLVWVMPLFSIFGKWDKYLSFHLYSGHQQRVILALSPSGVEKMKNYEAFLLSKRFFDGMPKELELMPWAIYELNAPFVSEDRIAFAVARKVVEVNGLDDSDGFFYRDYPMKLDQFGFEVIKPSELRTKKRLSPLVERRKP